MRSPSRTMTRETPKLSTSSLSDGSLCPVGYSPLRIASSRSRTTPSDKRLDWIRDGMGLLVCWLVQFVKANSVLVRIRSGIPWVARASGARRSADLFRRWELSFTIDAGKTTVELAV
jgi:hypothetical protein